MIAAIAAPMSAAERSGGKLHATTRSRRGGIIRSRQSRSATVSPASASSMAFRVSASASPSSSASAERSRDGEPHLADQDCLLQRGGPAFSPRCYAGRWSCTLP